MSSTYLFSYQLGKSKKVYVLGRELGGAEGSVVLEILFYLLRDALKPCLAFCSQPCAFLR